MTSLGIDPKNDYAFKRVFGSEAHTRVLVHVLNAVLEPPPGQASLRLLSYAALEGGRMGRPPRADEANGIYHMLNRGNRPCRCFTRRRTSRHLSG